MSTIAGSVFRSLLLLTLLWPRGVVVAQVGIGEWVSLGPEGAIVMAIVIDPSDHNTVYLGTDGGGVFKSTNGGASWSEANVGLFDRNVNALAIDPSNTNIIYVGTGSVFVSLDGDSHGGEIATQSRS